MRVEVHKFGGACLATPAKLQRAIQVLVGQNTLTKSKKIVVVSAVFGVTDLLRSAIKNLIHENGFCEESIHDIYLLHASFVQEFPYLEKQLNYYLDNLTTLLQQSKKDSTTNEPYIEQALVTGEKIMSKIFSAYLRSCGYKNTILTPEELKLYTDGRYFNATVDLTKDFTAQRHIIENTDGVIVVPGFYGINDHGHVTTFGRSGSDYSATIIGNIINASRIIIWKDVDGVMTADPKIVKNSSTLTLLTYDEAAELAYYGASVLHPLAMIPAKMKNIPIEVKNMHTLKTTKIGLLTQRKTSPTFVSYLRNIGIFQISKTINYGEDEILVQFKKICEKDNIHVLFISFSATQILFVTGTISTEQSTHILKTLKPVFTTTIEYYANMALITISCNKEKDPIQHLTSILNLFSLNKIKIRAISQGTVLTTFEVVVNQEFLETALTLVHNEFCRSS